MRARRPSSQGRMPHSSSARSAVWKILSGTAKNVFRWSAMRVYTSSLLLSSRHGSWSSKTPSCRLPDPAPTKKPCIAACGFVSGSEPQFLSACQSDPLWFRTTLNGGAETNSGSRATFSGCAPLPRETSPRAERWAALIFRRCPTYPQRVKLAAMCCEFPCPLPACSVRGGGTRRVQSVREEGRDVSSQYGRRDETCPVSTGGGTRRVPCCSPGASVRTKVPQATARPAADRSPFAVCFINMLVLHACLLVIHFSARRRRCLARATSRARSPCLTRRWGAHPGPRHVPPAHHPPPSSPSPSRSLDLV